MTITISREIEAQAKQKAAAEGLSLEAYVARLIREDEWTEFEAEPLNESDPEFAEVRAAVMEGLEQAERGEGQPVREFFAQLRAKHGPSR